jgi:hypothetical protein
VFSYLLQGYCFTAAAGVVDTDAKSGPASSDRKKRLFPSSLAMNPGPTASIVLIVQFPARIRRRGKRPMQSPVEKRARFTLLGKNTKEKARN